jgi:hypothetical protein
MQVAGRDTGMEFLNTTHREQESPSSALSTGADKVLGTGDICSGRAWGGEDPRGSLSGFQGLDGLFRGHGPLGFGVN